MSSALGIIINKIEKGQPFNMISLTNLLVKQGFSREDISVAFVTKRLSKTRWVAINVDPHFMGLMKDLVVEPGATRAEAALIGKSHSVNVSGCILTKRQGTGDPSVVMIANEASFNTVPTSRKALIIENEENFIHINRTYDFLLAHCGIDISDVDVYLGRGGYITNNLAKPLFMAYEHIYLYLDIDIGGAIIAKKVATMSPGSNIKFIIPNDIEDRLPLIKSTAEPEALEKFYKETISHPFLHDALRLVQKHKKFIEQEVFLND